MQIKNNDNFADFEQVKDDFQDDHLWAGQARSPDEFGQVKDDSDFADIGLVAARDQLNQITQLHLLPLMVGKI